MRSFRQYAHGFTEILPDRVLSAPSSAGVSRRVIYRLRGFRAGFCGCFLGRPRFPASDSGFVTLEEEAPLAFFPEVILAFGSRWEGGGFLFNGFLDAGGVSSTELSRLRFVGLGSS